jgi:hypothetical protein
MTRIYEGFLGAEMMKSSPKASLDMLRLDPENIGKMDYSEYYLGLFFAKEEIFKMDQVEICKRIWDRFDGALTIMENFILKTGFMQINHKSEIEYLQKEIG